MNDEQLFDAINQSTDPETGFAPLTAIVTVYAGLVGEEVPDNRISNSAIYKAVSSRLKSLSDEGKIDRDKDGRNTVYRALNGAAAKTKALFGDDDEEEQEAEYAEYEDVTDEEDEPDELHIEEAEEQAFDFDADERARSTLNKALNVLDKEGDALSMTGIFAGIDPDMDPFGPEAGYTEDVIYAGIELGAIVENPTKTSPPSYLPDPENPLYQEIFEPVEEAPDDVDGDDLDSVEIPEEYTQEVEAEEDPEADDEPKAKKSKGFFDSDSHVAILARIADVLHEAETEGMTQEEIVRAFYGKKIDLTSKEGKRVTNVLYQALGHKYLTSTPQGVFSLSDKKMPKAADPEERALMRQKAEEATLAMKDQYKDARKLMIDRASDEIDTLPDFVEVDQAIQLVSLIDLREKLHADATMIQRFLLGVVARRVKDAASYGENPLNTLAEKTQVHINTVRECLRLAESFKDNLKLFDRWLRVIPKKYNRAPRWYDVQNLIRSNEDPTVLGADALADRLMAQVERTAEKMDKISENGDAEGEGVILAMTEAATRFRQEGIKNLYPEEQTDKTPRDENYLQFVRSLACMATGDTSDVQAHHVVIAGKAKKGSDYSAIPLSVEAHRFLHNKGPRAFRKKYGIDVRECVARTLHMYITGQDLTFPGGR